MVYLNMCSIRNNGCTIRTCALLEQRDPLLEQWGTLLEQCALLEQWDPLLEQRDTLLEHVLY